MEFNAHLLLPIVALFLMIKIGLLHLFFCQKQISRSFGIMTLITSLWVLMLLCDSILPPIIYIIFTLLIIIFEIWYLVSNFHNNRAKTDLDESDPVQIREFIEDIELSEVIKSVIAEGDNTQIATDLNAWIETKGYLDHGVTIQRVAAELKSNRTYLSAYINSTYNTTFREWVTMQRLNEAKRLLVAERDATISNIAQRVGFASVASFSRAFTRQEGMPPVTWRENCP